MFAVFDMPLLGEQTGELAPSPFAKTHRQAKNSAKTERGTYGQISMLMYVNIC
jgi:hypothetical protein